MGKVAFSPDGQRLASVSYDQTINLWDLNTAKVLKAWNGHSIRATSVAFSPNGRRLASAGQDGTIRLWDAMTGLEIQTIKGQTSSLTSVAFSPDGNWLASAGHDNSVRLWDATTGEAALTLNGHSRFVTSVAFSPDSSRLVSASFDKTAKLWDVTTGQELLTLRGYQQQVSGIAFSPNGRQLATASPEGTVKVWDARDSDIQRLTRTARGVVARHSADSATRQELIVAIKNDPMLDERTKQQAVKFTEYFRENPGVYEARGLQLAARGELAKAAVEFGRAFDLQPDNVNLAQNWSYLLFSSGNVDEYRKACAKALLRFEHSDDARTLLVTVRILILSPSATDDSAAPLRLADKHH